MLRDRIKDDLKKRIKDEGLRINESDVDVTRTSDPGFGDFTTNIALRLRSGSSTANKQSPLEFAKKLTDSLKNQPYVEKLEVAGPGFINFWIKDEIWQNQVSDVLKSQDKYGSNDLGRDRGARVEFVSANPTGPLHFGNARGGPIGDCLASVLEFCGYKVVREYYHNDIGVQIEKLGEAILNVSKGQSLADQEYKGTYVQELAGKLKGADLGKGAVAILFGEILADCEAMGIKFDQFYAESGILKSRTKGALDKIKKFLKKKEGAMWFAPSDEFLKDRETVVIKSDGSYTYFANDIAYHDLKFVGNPDLVVDVFGANHHGHVPRLQAAIKALGYDVSKFHVILYQWVRFLRKGVAVKMSKRAGTFVTVREVLDEVGKDALRFFILMHDPNSHIDFDLDLAKKKSKDNPVYYVQYAHARICSILARTKDEGLRIKTDFGLLTTNYELDLVKQISRLPELVEDICQNFAVHRLTSYAVDLADSFHRFYENCRVVGEEKDLMQARLALITAAKIALENTLALLGVSAPQKM